MKTVHEFKLTKTEGDIFFIVVCSAGYVAFGFMYLLHYEVAVISTQIVMYHRDFCLACFDFEFNSDLLPLEVFCYFLFAYPTFGGFLIIYLVFLSYNQWFGMSKDVIDIANLTF